MNTDLDHLRLLSIFHYVVGGLAALFACFPLFHFFIGLAILVGQTESRDPMGPAFAIFMMVFAAVFILCGWAFAICLIVAGRRLAAQRSYTFCLVMAAVACIFMPFGTVLGVLTIVVLMRPSVKAVFEPPTMPEPASAGA
jgi:hypothetical protein